MTRNFLSRKQEAGCPPKDMLSVYNIFNLDMFPSLKATIHVALTVPGSSCSCERSFSALRRLLRQTMGQKRQSCSHVYCKRHASASESQQSDASTHQITGDCSHKNDALIYFLFFFLVVNAANTYLVFSCCTILKNRLSCPGRAVVRAGGPRPVRPVAACLSHSFCPVS